MRVSLILVLLLWAGAALAAPDYFGRQAPPTSPPPSAASATPAAVEDAGPLRRVIVWVADRQRDLMGRFQVELRRLRGEGSPWPSLAIIGLSFVYGIFHAAGPGHGKVVTTTYFLTQRARFLHGLALGGSVALVQALSAIVIVGVLAGVLDLAPSQVIDKTQILETASYLMIVALGSVMTWRVLRGRPSCGHDHDHEHGPECAHHGDLSQPPGGWREILGTAFAVGLRPCTGALLVLLFTLAAGIFWVGVISALAMGVGVTITLVAIGMGAIGLRRVIDRFAPDGARAERIRRWVALAGALTIVALGLLFLAGALERGGAAGFLS